MTKKRDSTMKRIIASAEVLFYSQGVNQTTQQDIANLADVNRGLIHYHFGSKQAIALHISRRFTR
ncbi:MAG: helix-turn-helix transcriptional regulator, partial [Oscillospiraceae bacterium]|nr:helix-turn-helix transcriptional regulator [Oscillospiraceae bacterium]